MSSQPSVLRPSRPVRRFVAALAWTAGALFSGAAIAATPIPAGPLVSTDWLAQNLDNTKVRIIEVSVNPGLYERAHIPGAVNFSWHHDLNDRVRLARP